ncbi:MAG TPA: HAMP domain-containing sensor histidine kinase [Phenylobacterium sp.]|jgi:signal transduction histidine kinase|uniref:sensor histidine kinase n=1 Tax=Phenylobacterium sp. TaxID=1871053 RepID=UPI002D6CF644|nr:HAMP domain-containing sensor histidine kinase [Phenylobacterium sp.]HZZ70143.1 HAMP domain-containing sensor histidine kinase [Phenylobacterium sp.]
MRPSELWRTTPFRLTLMNGAVFALAVLALMGLIYQQTAGYLGRQMDGIVVSEARGLTLGGAERLPDRVAQAVAADARHIEYYGLFSAEGIWITGNVRALPPGLPVDGRPHGIKAPNLQPGSRAMAQRLPWGEILVVGHDALVLSGLRDIVVRALAVSGGLALILGMAGAAALSLRPLQRIDNLRDASRAALKGQLGVRLPVSPRRDEIDMLAGVANTMMDEAERLLWEVKSVGENVAHDLRTPLNRLRALLYRVRQETRLEGAERAMIDQALAETDELLARFRALQRIGEIERRDRQAFFEPVRLQNVLEHVIELHEPLAEDRGVALAAEIAADAPQVSADPTLLFEAVSNLVDNALKFTPRGGRVCLRLAAREEGPRIEVADNGPGVTEDERDAVLQRFYRTQRARAEPGSGLGLSIVAAIARLHHFTLVLEDAHPGLRVALNCWPRGIEG